jgi:hypothetical protein
MLVSIVIDDNVVLVDGAAETVDCSALAAEGKRAVQWRNTAGHVEFASVVDPDTLTVNRAPNEVITDFSPYQPYVDAWQIEHDKPDQGPVLPPQPAPGSIAPMVVASAHADIAIGSVTLGPNPFNITNPIYVSKGVYKFSFINPLPDENYGASITCSAAAELADGQTMRTFTINTGTGDTFTPKDVRKIDFQIFRVPVT